MADREDVRAPWGNAAHAMDSDVVHVVDLDHGTPGPVTRATPEAVLLGTASAPARLSAKSLDSLAAFDVLLTSAPDAPAPWVSCADPAREAERLLRIAASAPDAVLALVHVLRMGPRLSPADRLVAESLAYSTLQAGARFRAWLADTPRPVHRPAPDPVRLRREGDVLTVTLDRPAARNAMDAATRDGLCQALELAVHDPSVRSVHLRGSGPSFCAGGDLSEFGTSTDPARAHRIRTARSPAALLLRCAPRVTAYLHGACVGAGIELSSFAGRVVAAPDTVIRLPEVAMGLIPGAGGTAGLPPRIGRRRTVFLAWSGAWLSVHQAHAWGLVDAVGDTG